MTAILKVPGDEVTMLVRSVETVASTAKAGTFRYQIDGTRPDGQSERTYLNTPVVDRELKRMHFTDAKQLIGDTWRFYRVAAPNNTPAAGYLNIEPGSAPTQGKPSVRAAAGITPPPALNAPLLNALEAFEAAGTPPSHHRDVPLPEAPDEPYAAPEGQHKPLPGLASILAERASNYFDLAERVAIFQAQVGRTHECPFDLASINAMTFSIWNSR